MKYVKILGLLAVAAGAIMAFAGNASATSVTSTTGGATTTPTIHIVNDNGTHIVIDNSIKPIECQSTLELKFESHGTGVTAKGNVTTATFFDCTNDWHVTTMKPGNLELHWTSSHSGTVTSSGWNLTATRSGITCNYETNNTDFGSFTGGNPATIHVESFISLAAGSSFLCGSGSAKWVGAYSTTAPLYIEK